MASPLLSYVFATNPAPLMASTASLALEGRVDAGVSGRGQQVYCDTIRVQVPIGTEAADAFRDTPTASVSTGRWVVHSVQRLTGPDAGPLPGSDVAQFIFAARDQTDYEISYDMALGLAGTVSDTPGSFGYTIQEHSGTTPNPDDYEWRTAVYPLDKTSAQLYLRNFVATTKDRQTAPATQVPAGAPLRLSWSSSGTWFQLYAGDKPDPVYQGRATFAELPGGISRDTSFFLIASASGSPGQDDHKDYQTIYAYAALSLAVTSPTLPGLSVTGALKADGSTTLTGPTTMTGAATLTGSSEFGATATFHRDVTVDGKMKAGQLDLPPSLTVQNLTATGSVRAPVVGGDHLQSQGGGAPIVVAGQSGGQVNHILFKWIGFDGSKMRWQLFRWNEGSHKWGGLDLPDGGYKTFVISHPLRPDRYLVHATLEGPEAAVYYRGTAQLAGGRAEVTLPDYADALTDPDSWTVQLTGIAGFDRLALEDLDGRTVSKGRFVVIAEDPASTQRFHWEAKGTRRDGGPLDVEPLRDGVNVHSVGPYTFAVPRDQG